jgi:hypothetical protein
MVQGPDIPDYETDRAGFNQAMMEIYGHMGQAATTSTIPGSTGAGTAQTPTAMPGSPVVRTSTPGSLVVRTPTRAPTAASPTPGATVVRTPTPRV